MVGIHVSNKCVPYLFSGSLWHISFIFSSDSCIRTPGDRKFPTRYFLLEIFLLLVLISLVILLLSRSSWLGCYHFPRSSSSLTSFLCFRKTLVTTIGSSSERQELLGPKIPSRTVSVPTLSDSSFTRYSHVRHPSWWGIVHGMNDKNMLDEID